MQSKDKLVCINDGWSTTVQQFAPVAPQPDPAPVQKAAQVAQAKPFVPIPAKKEAPPMVEPKIDQTIVVKRQLEKAVGNKKVEQAEQKIKAAKEVSTNAIQTYKDDLKELLPGETGRYLKVIGITLFGIFVLIMIFTLHLVPGL